MSAKHRLLITIAVTISALAAASALFQHGYQRYFFRTIDRMSEIAYGNSKYDLVFLGSSRVRNGIDPDVIDGVLGAHSLNLGMDGATIYEFRLVFEAFLEHHPFPDYVVLNLDLGAFNLKRKIYNSVPYFQFLGNRSIRTALEDQGYLPRYASWMPFLGVSLSDDHTRLCALRGLLGGAEPVSEIEGARGFVSPSASLKYRGASEVAKDNTVDPAAPEILDSIIRRVQGAGKRILLIYAPEYQHRVSSMTPNFARIQALFEAAARLSSHALLSYDNAPLSQLEENFRDPIHLSAAGAQAFSKLLATDLQRWIQTQKSDPKRTPIGM